MLENDFKELLIKANEAYYNTGTPIMSDEEYDNLLERYISLGNKFEFIGANPNTLKVTHDYKMYSLEKATTYEKLKLFIDKAKEIDENSTFVIMDKFDGLTITNIYKEKLVSAATRGNGNIGQSILEHVNTIDNLPKRINYNNKINIFGEAMMSKTVMNRLNESGYSFKNTRNAAAGTLNLLDIDEVKKRKLFTVMYGVNPYNLFKKHSDMLEFLKENNFLIPNYKICKTFDEVINEIETINSNKKDYDYDIDGVVISVNESNIKDKLGYTDKYPKWAIAFKFEQEGVWSKLLNVEWNTGKTGIIAPRGNIEPIEILGSTVSNVTLHNIAFIRALELEIGKEVEVIKANEIIPRIISSKGNGYLQIGAPNICPSCNSHTEFEGDILYCRNPNCIAQLTNKIINLASRDALDIEGLSEATVSKMIDYAKENDMELSLTLPFRFSLEDILSLPGFAEKSAKKLYDNIQKSKDTELKRFIYAANIPLIGRSASEDIANKVLTAENLGADILNGCREISSIEGIGDKMIEKLNEFGIKVFGELYDIGVVPKPVEAKKKNVSKDEVLTFVITGAFDIPRKEIEKMIKDAGHKTSGSVSSKTSYLLASPGEEGTSKYIKATSLGTKIINSLEELKEII